MSSPHVAGLAALYLGENPNATPAEIKSALMTTAYDHGERRRLGEHRIRSRRAPATSTRRSTSTPGLRVPERRQRLAPVPRRVSGSTTSAHRADRPERPQPRVHRDRLACQAADGHPHGHRDRRRDLHRHGRAFPGMTAVVSPSTLTFSAAGETQSFTVTLTTDDRARREVGDRLPHLDERHHTGALADRGLPRDGGCAGRGLGQGPEGLRPT